jgi:DNA-binding FadR family transcriptional regulator
VSVKQLSSGSHNRGAGRADVSLPQHRAIIDAVCRHDPDGVADAMRLHLESVADAIRAANT